MFVAYSLGIVACVFVGYTLGMRIWNRVRHQQSADIDYAKIDEEFYQDWPSSFEHDSTTSQAAAESDTESPAVASPIKIKKYERARKTQKKLQEKVTKKTTRKKKTKKTA